MFKSLKRVSPIFVLLSTSLFGAEGPFFGNQFKHAKFTSGYTSNPNFRNKGEIFFTSDIHNERNLVANKFNDAESANPIEYQKIQINTKVGEVISSIDGKKVFIIPPLGRKHILLNTEIGSQKRIKINKQILKASFSPSGRFLVYKFASGPNHEYRIYNTETLKHVQRYSPEDTDTRYQWSQINGVESLIFLNRFKQPQFQGDERPNFYRKSLIKLTLNGEKEGIIEELGKTRAEEMISHFSIHHNKFLLSQYGFGKNKTFSLIDLTDPKTILFDSAQTPQLETPEHLDFGNSGIKYELSSNGSSLLLIKDNQRPNEKGSFFLDLENRALKYLSVDQKTSVYDCLSYNPSQDAFHYQASTGPMGTERVNSLITLAENGSKKYQDFISVSPQETDLRCTHIAVREDQLRVYFTTYSHQVHQFFTFKF